MKPGLKLPEGQLRLGEISGLHGVQGWVKVFSDTQPRENIFSYKPWLIYHQGPEGLKAQQLEVLHWRKQGKTLVAKLKGLDDREQARALLGSVVAIEAKQLPDLNNDEYYWHQLVGMKVLTDYDDSETELGIVEELIETGSNDVMIVRSADKNKEHLVPWILGEYVLSVDLQANLIRVHWDPEF